MVNRTAAQDGALMGMKEICRYMDKSEPTIIRYINTMSFPAKKVNGVWLSDAGLIREWRLALLLPHKQKKR
ncbi:MAG: helix-turn-helix domain-containing protein [Candidatus Adiutrix sp.]|nr:helix-turn-helix domain-containing protein [Candidatus Adiutrix sp.]